MYCRYTFTVISDVALPMSVCFNRGLTKFTFRSENGRFTALVVEQPGVKMIHHGRIEAAPPGGIGQVTIPGDPLVPFVQIEIRAVRGSLALWGVSDIDIDHPLVEWLPESEEEKKALVISSFRYGNTAPGSRPPRTEPIDQLIRPFLSWQGFLPVEIPLEYFRRGAEDLAKGHYIEAIYDFYFVIEFLFAGGKFTKHSVREAMLDSAEAKRIIAESQKHVLPDIRDNTSDLARFNNRYRNRTVEEVIDTLTDLRGLLHHQSQTRQQKWHPASPEQFKVDAYFLCAAAHSAVLNLSTSILFTPEAEAKFNATQLFAPDGRKIVISPLPEPPGADQFEVPPEHMPKAPQ
jgi:hypothetical protein